MSPVRAVVALAIAETASWGILHYGFGILLAPIAKDLGTSEVVVAGAYSIALLAGGLAAAPIGRALDRHGARAVMTAGACAATVALLLLAGARGVATLYLAWAIIGVAQAAVLYEPAFAAITSWFESDRDRLRAIVGVTLVAGFASTIFGPLIARATSAFGWRLTVVAMAAMVLLVVTPIHASLPATRATPRARSTAHDDVRMLSWVFAAHAFASTGLAVQLVAHLVETGASITRAAAIAGTLGVAQVAGRLTASAMRTMSAAARMTVLLGAQSVALVAIGSGAALFGVVVFGLSNGLVTIERVTIVAERYGRDHYGENSGRIARVGLIVRAAAPFVLGWARAHFGAKVAFSSLALLLALAAGALNLELAPQRTVR